MANAYPATLEARLDPPLSKWKWLIKWFLLIPHIVVLAFLWVAAVVVALVAWIAILITGRYPRGIFDFIVGVMRWTWRVEYYGYNALATEKYPPFSLGEDPSYPIQFRVEYPDQLSRLKTLFKWILAIPQFIIVSAIDQVIIVLALVGAIMAGFGSGYSRSVFDLVMGLNRWTARVGVYALLMTDEYPPFRLDMGPTDTRPAA